MSLYDDVSVCGINLVLCNHAQIHIAAMTDQLLLLFPGELFDCVFPLHSLLFCLKGFIIGQCNRLLDFVYLAPVPLLWAWSRFLSHWSIRSTMFRLRSGVYRYNSCLSPDALSYDLTDPGPFPLLVPTGLCTRQGKKPCRPGSGTCKIYIKHQRMRYYHYTLMLLNCVSPFKFSF